MSWTYATLLALLAVLLALSLSPEADSAAVPSSTGSAKDPQGQLKKIFMREADASNFFRRRSRRGVKSQDEINTEQRLILAADERKREFHEEKRNEFESYAEEEHDGMHTLTSDVAEKEELIHSTGSFIRDNSHNLPEQNERTRESTEQWREFHYDGMHPPQEYNRQSI